MTNFVDYTGTAQVVASAPGIYPVQLNLALMSRGGRISTFVVLPPGVTASYSVLMSGDPPNVTPANWHVHDSLGEVNTTTNHGSSEFPAQWLALNLISVSGGSVVMNVNQPRIPPVL